MTDRASKAFSFATHSGVYEPKRMPMGARNAASHFQKVISQLLSRAGLLYNGVLLFIDDILVYAKSPSELAALWKRVWDTLREANIYMSPDKTQLYASSVVFLFYFFIHDYCTQQRNSY